MRVYTGSNVSGVANSGAVRRAGAGGSRFSLSDGGIAKTNSTLGVAPLTNLDALMSLQEVDDPVERKKRIVKRGHNILDSLNQLKASMLAGKVPSSDLQRIVDHLRQREPSNDVHLDDILAQIELRAEVELAKLSMRIP
jgi:Class II flagellar assembly regulator